MAPPAPLVANTEEVPIVSAVPPRRALHDHAPQQPLLAALAAEQGALEVLVVDPPPLSGHAVFVQHPLDSSEQFLFDEGLVPSLDLFALVGDNAQVVAAAEDPGPFLGRDH